MSEPPVCPICEKRRPERLCPAKGEKICAVCCGTEREVTLDCPPDCPYLLAAHRYELEHRKPLAENEVPFPTVEFSPNLIYDREAVVSGFGSTVLKFAHSRPELSDLQVLAAASALADTYRTLSSGIYYENPPAEPLAGALYAALGNFVQDYKKQEQSSAATTLGRTAVPRPATPAGTTPLKDTEIYHLLVFLARMVRMRTNGRPRARQFLQFLRTQFPPSAEAETPRSRIIIP